MKKLLLSFFTLTYFVAFSQWQSTSITSSGFDCISAFGNVYSSGAAASNALDVSTNDGASWSSSNTNMVAGGLYFGTFDGTKLYTCRGATIMSSSSPGNNWTAMTNTFTSNHNVRSMTSLSGTVMAAVNNMSALTARIWEYNGSTWIPRSTNYSSTQFNCVRNLNGTLFAGTTATCVMKSTDGGLTFTNSSTGIPVPVFWDKFVNCLAATSTAIFCGNQGGRICKSVNNGASWTTAYLIGDGSLSIDISDIYVMSNNNILVACDSGFVYSTDNGATWQKDNNGLSKNSSGRYDVNHVTVSSGSTPYIIISDRNGKIMRRPLNQIFSGMNEIPYANTESKAYPNPASNFVTVEVSALNSETNCSVKVMDVLGREVSSVEMKDGKANVDLTGLNKGLYTYSVLHNTTPVSKGKLVVN